MGSDSSFEIRHSEFASHHLQQRVRHFARRDGDADAGGFECGNLRFGSAFTATDDCARMAHAASGRRGRAGDESGDKGTAEAKIAAFKAAGIGVAVTPSEMAETLLKMM